MKFVIAGPRDGYGDAVYTLVRYDTGEVLASHVCSHIGFAKNDLLRPDSERCTQWGPMDDIEVVYDWELEPAEKDALIQRNREFANG